MCIKFMEIKLSEALATNLLQNLSNPLDGFVSYIFYSSTFRMNNMSKAQEPIVVYLVSIFEAVFLVMAPYLWF